MAAMETKLALGFYQTGTCRVIDWPMSTESWAYPFQDDKVTSKPNGKDYTQWTGVADAKTKIQKYMDAAGVSAGDTQLKIKFTVAGASITEHPTYAVFKQAAELLNEMGWEVEVKADSQALTKLSTGSLEVWAAAWGSTIDPDMYQVYHKNSSATSVYAWGYREIKSQSKYEYEQGVIDELSDYIDQGRATTDKETRKGIYEKAMGLVLDLAVELPVYQRMTLYAYNNKTIKGLSNEVNPYTSPLAKTWDLELA
jgi:peptide/nickel transport system substrate-binding protein